MSESLNDKFTMLRHHFVS